MFSRIVVGVDGGPGGRDAMALATALAGPRSGLLLVKVWRVIDGVAAAALGANPPRRRANDDLSTAAIALGRPCRTRAVGASSVAAGLHGAVEDAAADLLVVGAHAEAPGHAALSDQTRLALHGARCAVAVVGSGSGGDSLRRIGVGYEPTPEADEALRVARDIAGRHGASLEAISALPPVPSPWAGAYGYAQVIEDLTGTRRREAEARLDALEGCATQVVEGEPATALLRAAERLDLLVLGSRGYGPWRRLLFGSTSDAVARGAPCTVLVVPRQARAIEGEGAQATQALPA